MASGFILTFHSHNIGGNGYATNDHVALDESIAILKRLNVPVVRLLGAVKRLRAGRFDTLPERFACLTFDDGTDYDWADMSHAEHGFQPSMYSILRKHSRHVWGSLWWRPVHATSFVIASPQARGEMQTALPVWLSDDWWRKAQVSGLMDIGSHGWDHVHPLVSDMKGRPDLVEAFHRIDTPEEARLQLEKSFKFIRHKAGGDAARLFAYPYGQVSDFIAADCLPRQSHYVGACATDPRPMRADSNPWRIPRYVCGWHWKSPDDLVRILVE